jgi:transposase
VGRCFYQDTPEPVTSNIHPANGISHEFLIRLLVLDSKRTIVDVAQGIGMKPQTLGKWVKKARDEQPANTELEPEERAELEQLRKEISELRMENEFLKKATAWFAKNQR